MLFVILKMTSDYPLQLTLAELLDGDPVISVMKKVKLSP
jgi:hypothetical protein